MREILVPGVGFSVKADFILFTLFFSLFNSAMGLVRSCLSSYTGAKAKLRADFIQHFFVRPFPWDKRDFIFIMLARKTQERCNRSSTTRSDSRFRIKVMRRIYHPILCLGDENRENIPLLKKWVIQSIPSLSGIKLHSLCSIIQQRESDWKVSYEKLGLKPINWVEQGKGRISRRLTRVPSEERQFFLLSCKITFWKFRAHPSLLVPQIKWSIPQATGCPTVETINNAKHSKNSIWTYATGLGK